MRHLWRAPISAVLLYGFCAGWGSFGLFAVQAAAAGNEPLYVDPFDLGAGGTVMTRATKEGMVFGNPALLSVGGGNLRWIGETTSILANKESIGTAEEMLKANGKSAGGSSASQTSDFVNKVFKDPVHVGVSEAVGFVSSAVAVTAFVRVEPDIEALRYGETGLPELRFRSEAYDGLAVGLPIPTGMKWLNLGVTGKYLMANEQDITTDVTDEQQIKSFESPQFLKSLTGLNKGAGADFGSLIFLQGSTVDWSLAATVDDIGGTKLVGPATAPTSLKQVESLGLGLSVHTGADALHFEVDYRDLANAYKQDLFKRVYVGSRLLLRNHLGLAAGYYDGYPTYGAEVDLWILRLAATAYTRELGDHPGVDPRHIYLASISLGF